MRDETRTSSVTANVTLSSTVEIDRTRAPDTSRLDVVNHPSSFSPHPSVLPPWHLRGEAIAFFDGRGIALLVNYTHSPVGAYHEMARVGFTSRGPKVVRMQVDSLASRRGGRRGWGFPKTFTPIAWQRRANRVEVCAHGATLRWRAVGPALPISLRAFTVQRFRGADVRVPVAVSGRARFAFRGRQIGVVLKNMTLVVAEPK